MNSPSTPLPRLIRKSLGWCIALSVLMIAAGLLAIIVPPAGGIAVTILVGWLLVFSGLAHLVYAWHTRGAGSVIWEILLGIAYLCVGGYMLYHPLLGMAALTLALAIYLFAESILEFILAVRLRPQPGTGWLIAHGLVALILAVMIWRTWPSSTAWVLGTLVGISMLFSGITRLMVSLAARKLVAQAA
jgi:uncharacterized membrane protein HdeD (DUF308 family)